MINNVHFIAMISGNTHPQLPEMEDFTERYPWCGLGHKLLFEALCAAGPEVSASYTSRVSTYLYNRAELYAMAHTPARPCKLTPPPPPLEKTEVRKVEKEAEEMDAQEIFEIIPEESVPSFVMAGGDYFNRQDMGATSLEEGNCIDRFIRVNPRFMPQQSLEETEEKVSLLEVDDDDFMTETLAKIYEDQGLTQLAIDAYSKLILLYPKKSTYFATLIQDIKFKINR